MSVIIGILHIVLLLVATRFAEIFEGFGAQLPFLTQAFLPGSIVYFIIPTATLLAYAARYFNFGPTRAIFLGLSIASALFLPVFIIAMYLPIIRLGAVV